LQLSCSQTTGMKRSRMSNDYCNSDSGAQRCDKNSENFEVI
jgi:hypothetical protein